MQYSQTRVDGTEFSRQSTCGIRSILVHEYIERKYLDCYNAEIQCTYNNILYVTDKHNCFVAAVGYRQPEEAFFLEQYLDANAEAALSQLYNEPVSRSKIVEIGNMVGDNSHAVFFLMQELWSHLVQRDFQHVLLTCTSKLKRKFRNLPLTTIAAASRDDIKDPEMWGTYYEQNPCVMTGKLSSYDQRFSHHRYNGDLRIAFVDGRRHLL